MCLTRPFFGEHEANVPIFLQVSQKERTFPASSPPIFAVLCQQKQPNKHSHTHTLYTPRFTLFYILNKRPVSQMGHFCEHSLFCHGRFGCRTYYISTYAHSFFRFFQYASYSNEREQDSIPSWLLLYKNGQIFAL